MVSQNILDKFLTEGVYSNTKKTITIIREEEEIEGEVIGFETYTIGENYLKRTYSYDNSGNPTLV